MMTFSDTRCSEFRTSVIVTTQIQQNQKRDIYQSIIIWQQYLILIINDRRVEMNQQTVREENNITMSLHDRMWKCGLNSTGSWQLPILGCC